MRDAAPLPLRTAANPAIVLFMSSQARAFALFAPIAILGGLLLLRPARR
jgi:hypothetical protein